MSEWSSQVACRAHNPKVAGSNPASDPRQRSRGAGPRCLYPANFHRRVAQPGRALRSGRRGRRFNSCHADHLVRCITGDGRLRPRPGHDDSRPARRGGQETPAGHPQTPGCGGGTTCAGTYPVLWGLLPREARPAHGPRVPPVGEFLENCAKYRTSLDSSIVQPLEWVRGEGLKFRTEPPPPPAEEATTTGP